MLTPESKLLDRRRSLRVSILFELLASGRDPSGQPFEREARTHTISEFGCLALLDVELLLGQPIHLVRPESGKSFEGKVVSVWRHPDGSHFVGISFAESAREFWNVPFALG